MATTKTENTTAKTKADGPGFANAFSLPNFDFAALVDSHRKNFEALVEANRVAFDGYKGAAEKQAQLLSKAIDGATTATRETMNAKTPEANASKQVEFAQGLAKDGFEGLREIADLAFEANRAAFSVLQKRIEESVEEIKTLHAV